MMIAIQPLTAQDDLFPPLLDLLKNAVEDGASIGFLLPFDPLLGEKYWQTILAEVADGSRLLWGAYQGEQLVGCVQLEFCPKQNGLHRAEVQKLLVHTASRRQGIAQQLMQTVEAAAQVHQRPLLVLDTRMGDASEFLYRKLGYHVSGIVPRYARSTNGQLDDCIFFYKELNWADHP